MPELPEVEVVRAGLAAAVNGARVVGVEVNDSRAIKRHQYLGGQTSQDNTQPPVFKSDVNSSADFERRLTGSVFAAPARRGKFLWLPIVAESPQEPAATALLAHLGMSGQMLLRTHEAPDDRHVRVRIWLEHPNHGPLRLDFADQRLFGSLAIDQLVPTADGQPAGWGTDTALMPSQAVHIARDPLDPAFDDHAFVSALRGRTTAVKRALLDQTLISGVGNIYADESLWLTKLHPETPGRRIASAKAHELLNQVRTVFQKALAEGGTSFDAQYVNVNGQAGYFAHSLNAYGRTAQPCPRCDTPIKRVQFMNRSSHFCPRCQRRR